MEGIPTQIKTINQALIKTTNHIMPSGKLCPIMRRDRTLTSIYRRIPQDDNNRL